MGIFVITRLVAGSFEARLKNQLLEAGRVVSDEVVNRERLRLEIQRVVVSTIGVADALVDRDTVVLEELISPIIANARLVDSIIVVDTQGREVIRFQRETVGSQVFVTTQASSGLNLSGWPAVAQVLRDPAGNKAAQLVRDQELGELMIYTIGPVRTSSGIVGAALVGTYLRNELATLQNLALAQLTLFDDNGKVLISTFNLSENDEAKIFSFFTPERYERVIQNQEITFLDQVTVPDQEPSQTNDPGSITVRERGYRLAYAPFKLRGQPFGVYAVALPTSFITDATNQSRDWLIGLFSVGVATVFGIGYFVAQRISRPILRLVQTSRAISAGDLDQRTGLQREDEIGILATTFDDMTSKLQHLLKLQEEEASKLNAILKSIADGVIVQDPKGEILIMNPAAEQILSVMGRNFERATLTSGGSQAPLQPGSEGEQVSHLLGRLTSLEFRETHRFEAGQQVLSALSAPVFTTDNVQLGSVVILRDITREVESEKLKDDFITSVSHELITPLTAIRGYNELLKMTATGKLDERQQLFIDTIGANVDDLLEIIQQMLDLSQIDAGTLGIDWDTINLSELIKTEAAAWIDKMQERDMSFVTRLPDTPVWVTGDQNRLTRVVHNLIKNAHDYTLPGGKVEVLLEQENGHVKVNVKDSGVGISKKDQRFLFTRFFRAIHEESTFEVSGAGLGLYTSKAIVEAHNGKMWMESEPNHGSTFSFILPIAEPEADDDWDE